MDIQSVENFINDLIQVDIDASFAYKEAIKSIEEEDIREQLISFKNDHERHIENLSFLLKKAGGEPIQYSQDLKGYVIQSMTWLRSITGTEGALKAMASNEKITNDKYHSASLYSEGLSAELQKQILKNYEDEKRHMQYITQKIEELKFKDT